MSAGKQKERGLIPQTYREVVKTKNRGSELARSGLKNTKHRKAILEILKQSTQPLAAERVFALLKNNDISVNLSTVYRTLETLSDKDIAVKLNLPGESRYMYEYNQMVHKHYLTCLGCKKIISIEHCPLADYERAIARDTNYSISGHKLNVYGYCPDCQREDQTNL